MDFHLQNYNFMVGILGERELEHILRLIVCPRKQKFLCDKMNLIDLLAVLPFFLSAALVGLEDLQVIGKAGKIIRCDSCKGYLIISNQISKSQIAQDNENYEGGGQ